MGSGGVVRAGEILVGFEIFSMRETVSLLFLFTKPQILFVDLNTGHLNYFMHGFKGKKSIFRKKKCANIQSSQLNRKRNALVSRTY